MSLRCAAVLIVLAGCAAPAESPRPRAGFEQEYRNAVERLALGAAYAVRYEIESGGRSVKGVAERFRGGVLKIRREEGGRRERLLIVGEKAWTHGGSGWTPGKPALIDLEDPLVVVEAVRSGTPSWVGRETVGEFECSVVLLPVESMKADVRVWYHGEGVERFEVAGAGVKAVLTVVDARSTLRLTADDEPSPWSEEMKAAAVKAAEEKRR